MGSLSGITAVLFAMSLSAHADAPQPSPSPDLIPLPPAEICFGDGCADAPADPEAAAGAPDSPNAVPALSSVPHNPNSVLVPRATPSPQNSSVTLRPKPTPLPGTDFELSDPTLRGVQVFCRWVTRLDCTAGDSCTGDAACERWSASEGVLARARVSLRCEGKAKDLSHPQACLRARYQSLRIPSVDIRE